MKRMISLLWPRLTWIDFLRRVPFYLNMISLGYLVYWTRKLELHEYPPWGSYDKTGFFMLAQLVFFLSSVIVLISSFNSFLARGRFWRAEAVYTLFLLFYFLLWLPEFLGQFLTLGPSS